MAAKLLHSLTDDNPDLRKQIGCMTGIFQMFERQHIVTGRRITGHSPRRTPPGDSPYNNSTCETESNNRYHRGPVMEKQSNKNIHDKQRLSTESSRASFSSSSRSSSFSSLDCNRTAQPEPISFDRMIFSEIPSRDRPTSQSSASLQFERQSLDLRDVVKDSIYRELRELSVKTTTEEVAADHLVRDSPRPVQLAKANDGDYSIGPDLEESRKVLAELREAPWYFDEPSKLSRSSSYQLRNGSSYAIPKDAPRYSYDGREKNHFSFESHESTKQALKLKDLPRHSLDSRESSMHGFNTDSQSTSISRNMELKNPSVVAKLMGLETLPESATNCGNKTVLVKTSQLKEPKTFSKYSKANDQFRPIQTSNSSRNAWKEPTSPRWKAPEPAPWRLLDGARGSQKPVSRHMKAPAKVPSAFPSVYSEIENRLKDLEFRQSGKDLRALKQIIEAMQAKGLLETNKVGQDSKFSNQQNHEQVYRSPIQNTREVNQRMRQNDQNTTYTPRGSNSSTTFEYPIVIMKPAKSGIPKLQGGDFPDNRKGSVNSRTAKDQNPKSNQRHHIVVPTDTKTNVRILKPAQTSIRDKQLSKESTGSSVKSLGSISPRLQQKKLELEKRARPPTPPSDSSKSRKPSNKQQVESTSPCGRRRSKSSTLPQSDDQISSEMRNSNYKENANSLQSDESIVVDSKLDIEVTSSLRPGEINGNHSPSMQASKYSRDLKKSKKLMLNEDETPAELATISPEYPSPISVLDGVYIDDAASASPLKQMIETLEDNSLWSSNDNATKKQRPVDSHMASTTTSGLTSEVNRKKLQSIEHLVQKLRRLNSTHDEAGTDYIASLCENTNPDDRYISEILLASGLLLRDLGSNLTTFQFHQSGYPINPELFLVLEQTKASKNLLKEEHSSEKGVQLKSDKEKFHRKLVFDAVNEILVGKLDFLGSRAEPWLWPPKLARKTLNAQKLLRELCSEIEQLQVRKPACIMEDEDDGLKNILWEDIMNRSGSFTDFGGEISGLVLDVERSLFKDLVGEIVTGEADNLRAKAGRRRRQLFVK